MTKPRREQLVRLARRYDALIILDDVYDFLNWGLDLPLPRLTDIDSVLDGGPATSFGNAISNGSFSKLLGPGLRAGWAEGTPDFVHGLSRCGSTMSGCPPSQVTSWLAAETISSGGLDKHIDDVLKPALQRKAKVLLDAVKSLLVPLGVDSSSLPPEITGGYFLCVQLPSKVEASAFCRQARREKDLLLAPDELFAVRDGEGLMRGRNFLRLCFAHANESQLVEAIRRMADLLSMSILDEPRADGVISEP